MSLRIMSIGAHPTVRSVKASMIDRGRAGMKSIGITKLISTLQVDPVNNPDCRRRILLPFQSTPQNGTLK
jgi:hypothetical protein